MSEPNLQSAGESRARRPRTTRRADFERSRELLIDALGFVAPTATRPLRLTDIAKHAGLGQATAYRHFSSLDELLGAYFQRIVSQLNDYSQRNTLTGPALFDSIAQRWVELVLVNGRAMVHLRSPRGYIERLRREVDYVVLMDRALNRAIQSLLEDWKLPSIGDQALQLWNVIFDPREILDSMNTLGFSKPEIVERFSAAFKGALFAVAWVQAGKPSDSPAHAIIRYEDDE